MHAVAYCCKEHQKVDRPCHAKVCRLLHYVRVAEEEVEVDEEKEAELLSMFTLSPRVCGPAMQGFPKTSEN